MINIFTALPQNLSNKEEIGKIMQAGLDAADPEKAVRRHLEREGNRLLAGGREYDLSAYERILLIGAGKASFAMSKAVAEILDDKTLSGAIIVKYLPEDSSALSKKGIQVLEGEHPKPGLKSVESTREIVRMVRETGPKGLIIFTLSGGASALLTSPREGIDLQDMQNITGLLLESGANIGEINTLRKHLDEVKGGGLARMTQPAEMLVLILSDVIGSPLDVIGSGPATGDPGSFAQAWKILEKYQLVEQAPASVVKIFRDGMAGRIPETIKPEDPILAKVNQVLVGSNEQSVRAAREAAEDLNFETTILTTALVGEAREVGAELAQELAVKCRVTNKPFCLLAGGETTVTIRGSGIGGRNLELALGAVEGMAACPGGALISLATDGDDGPSGAAGAVVTGETLGRAEVLGLEPRVYLEKNDSLAFFEKAGGLLVTRPTGTNVNDMVFLFGNFYQL
jgi:glycerate 2-kinase